MRSEPSRNPQAVVLFSGGLDSTTTLAMAIDQGYRVYVLSFRYGQRHDHELRAAHAIAAQMPIQRHLVVDLHLDAFGGSALTTDDIPVPKAPSGSAPASVSGTPNNAAVSGSVSKEIPVTYIPARNTVFLSHALAWAEALGAFDIFIGVNAVDYSGYPDCRPAFVEAFENLANLATREGVEGGHYTIHAPLIQMNKAEIIQTGMALGVDYALTHSCYDPDPMGRACGACDACRLRRAGFEQAGVKDPTPYAPPTLTA